MTPSSRGGHSSQYNLFPWRQKPHQAWHFLFFNMTIDEVWEKLDEIHAKIFDPNREVVARSWIHVCSLDTKDLEKLYKFQEECRSFMEKKDSIFKLQREWEKCFGGASLERAELVIKYMMLFIIFGEAMADPEEYIFDNGHLEKLLRKIPQDGIRRWALEESLGNSESLGNTKAKVAHIIDKVRQSL